jgi:hypothetical protein
MNRGPRRTAQPLGELKESDSPCGLLLHLDAAHRCTTPSATEPGGSRQGQSSRSRWRAAAQAAERHIAPRGSPGLGRRGRVAVNMAGSRRLMVAPKSSGRRGAGHRVRRAPPSHGLHRRRRAPTRPPSRRVAQQERRTWASRSYLGRLALDLRVQVTQGPRLEPTSQQFLDTVGIEISASMPAFNAVINLRSRARPSSRRAQGRRRRPRVGTYCGRAPLGARSHPRGRRKSDAFRAQEHSPRRGGGRADRSPAERSAGGCAGGATAMPHRPTGGSALH